MATSPEPIEIRPLVLTTQAFPARPSSLPEIRDFIRRRLTPATLSEEDVRILGDRAAEMLLEAAGGNRTIQVSLRTFPGYAEVDVLFGDPAPPEPSPDATGLDVTGPDVPGPASEGAERVPFADWLGAALRREGMTLEAAARRLDVSVKTVSRWTAGTTEPRLRDLSRIREVFGAFPFP